MRRAGVVVAFALALSTLAATIGPVPRAHAETPALRTITMRLALDSRVMGDEGRTRQIVEQVSAIYERAFQIRWEVLDVVPWTPAGPVTLRLGDTGALRPEARPPAGAAEVVVALSADTCAPREPAGVADPFGAIVVIKPRCILRSRLTQMVSVLSHELAHLFGAFHVVRGPSVMLDGGPPDAFDDQTARVIRLMRDRDFRRGVDAIDDARRAAFLEIFAESHRPGDANPLVAALTRAGATWLDAGQTAEAIPRFREALYLDPSSASSHRGLGIALTRERRLDEAIEALREAVRLEPRSGLSHAHLALALREQGKLDDAIAELRQALAFEPRNAAVQYQMAITLLRAGRRAEATLHAERGRALNPDVPPELVDLLR